jgi:tetratricopeptide (TPR) repeat protein
MSINLLFKRLLTAAAAGLFLVSAGSARELTGIVERIQPAVVTVVTYDINRMVSGFGSGFFVSGDGHLVTNYHVMEGAYSAQIRTPGGGVFEVDAVVAENKAADLVKLRVSLPSEKLRWLNVADTEPAIAERIVVVGSPMGLEQTVSEGIVSAVREMPGIGKFFQISAPISQGSSGGPVLNLSGQVIGIVTFMVAAGQNLNFAVAAEGIKALHPKTNATSVAQWTYSHSLKAPGMAEELCRQGFQFSINGEYSKAIEFYKQATQKDPENTIAWYGLGYCYTGLEEHDAAVDAYQQAIRINPDDSFLRFSLGNYYMKLGRIEDGLRAYSVAVSLDPDYADAHTALAIAQTELGLYEKAIGSHRQVIRIHPESSAAYFNMGVTMSKAERTGEAIDAYGMAVRLEPENIFALHNMAVLLARTDRHEAAISAHKKVIRRDPDHVQSHYFLGKAFLAVGDKPAALDQYKIVKRLDKKLADQLFDLIYP